MITSVEQLAETVGLWKASLAEELIAATCVRQSIAPGQPRIHVDRGSSMTSKPVALLMSDLGVTKTHSPPHVSNDNPCSESQFTSADVHFGRAQTILDQHQQVLHAAYLKNPERFVKGPSAPAPLPPAVWINPPTTFSLETRPFDPQLLNESTLIF